MGEAETGSLAELKAKAIKAIKAVFPSVDQKVIEPIERATSYDGLRSMLAGLHFDLDPIRNPHHEKLLHDLKAVGAEAHHQSVLANASKREPFRVLRSVN